MPKQLSLTVMCQIDRWCCHSWTCADKFCVYLLLHHSVPIWMIVGICVVSFSSLGPVSAHPGFIHGESPLTSSTFSRYEHHLLVQPPACLCGLVLPLVFPFCWHSFSFRIMQEEALSACFSVLSTCLYRIVSRFHCIQLCFLQ